MTHVGLGEVVDVCTPLTCRCVTESTRRLFVISTSRLKCRRKSVPSMACLMSAIKNTHRKGRHSPMLRVWEVLPNVAMGELLTACKGDLQRGRNS